MNNPTPATMAQAQLLDAALLPLQAMLESSLSWLSKAYGKAEKREVLKDGALVRFPAVYSSRTEYLSLLPDEHLGAYCFFDPEDGQEIEWRGRTPSELTARGGLVFWFDFRDLYPSTYQQASVENVKAEVLEAIRINAIFGVRVTPQRFWDRAENIYRGYSASEIRNQFLMRPYGGFRLDVTIDYENPCP